MGKWRSCVATRCGSTEFDAPAGGYSFSKVLAEERKLAEENVPGDSKSALLTLSVADPTKKMPNDAFYAGMEYFFTNKDATRYTDLSGARNARVCQRKIVDTNSALADILNRKFGDVAEMAISLDPENVQYSPGSIKRALAEYIPAAFFDQDTLLIMPTPGYGVITAAENCRGAKVVEVPLIEVDGHFDLDFGEIARIRNSNGQMKAFIYLNVPHNPSGYTYDYEEWYKVMEWAKANDIMLIVDEAYIDISYDDDSCSILYLPGWMEQAIVLQSVSKGWNATGLRFGWILGDKDAIGALRRVMDKKDSGTFGPSIISGLGCLLNPDFAEKTRMQYEELHEALAKVLIDAGLDAGIPGAGLCQLTPVPKSAFLFGNEIRFQNAQTVAQWLRKKFRISVMHYDVGHKAYLRWAVTLSPVPECNLNSETEIIHELGRRLGGLHFDQNKESALAGLETS